MTASETDTKKFVLQPGINKNTTQLDAEGTYVSCDKVRFFYEKPQKLGGCQLENYQGSIVGKARDILAWTNLSADKYLTVGTHKKLQVFSGGVFHDITPIRTSASVSNAFSVASGDSYITLSVNPQGAAAGDRFILATTTVDVGGLTLAAGNEYEIASVGVGHIVFQASASTSATTSVSSVGGPAVVDFLLETGAEDAGFSFGWGGGTWNTPGVSVCAGWNEPRGGTGVALQVRQWSLDTWGEDLIANPRGGKIYVWDMTDGVGVRASVITNAPTVNNIAFMGNNGRHLVTFGTHNVSGIFDPMLIRWSDSENYNKWTAAATNQAGSYRLEHGTEIIGATETKNEILVFTDDNAYSMRRIGGQLVFSFNDLGRHNGLASQHAAVDVNGTTYWMGFSSFHVFDGVIRTLPCSLQKVLFNPDSAFSINQDQIAKVFSSPNREFNEVWWLYPSRDSTECDRYVIYNFAENLWYHGAWNRTVFLDKGTFDRPYAVDTSGHLYIHEQGKDVNTSGMKSFVITSFVDLADGDNLMFVDRVIPDNTITKEMSYEYTYKKYPQSTEEFTKGPFTVTPTTKKVNPRIRGRQVQVKYSTSVLGGDFRIGGDRYSFKPDGER